MVELLVVAGIILVLAALIVPVVFQMLGRAKAVACLSNLRQYGTALLTYAGEQDGLPSWDGSSTNKPDFNKMLVPAYLSKTLRCPLANSADLATNNTFFYNGNASLCILYNKLKGIPAPSSRVILAAEMYAAVDQGFTSPTHLNATMWGNDGKGANVASEGATRKPQFHGPKERRGLNCFFLDGSVAFIHPYSSDWWNASNYVLTGDDYSCYYYYLQQFAAMKNGTLRPH